MWWVGEGRRRQSVRSVSTHAAAPAARTSMMLPSALLGTTMKRRERGGVLSGSEGSSSCIGRGCSVVRVLQAAGRAGARRVSAPAITAATAHCCVRSPHHSLLAAAASSRAAALSAGGGASVAAAAARGSAPTPAAAATAPSAPPAPHLVCGESASSTLSRGPCPSFSVTSCRFSIARAAEEARSYLT